MALSDPHGNTIWGYPWRWLAAMRGSSLGSQSDNARNATQQSKNDALAFESFFRRYEPQLTGYLWRMTGDEEAAHDLCQETFVRAWQHFVEVSRYDQPKAWLFRVATNLALNHKRRHAVNSNHLLPQHALAKSVDGGPLEWTDKAYDTIYSMYALGSTLYIAVLGGCPSGDTVSCRIIQSNDEGTTWSQFPLSNLAHLIYNPPIVSGDGKTIFMVDSKNQLLSSADGGHSWLQIASYSGATTYCYCTIKAILPDRTLYLTVSSQSPPNLHKLVKGATSWILTASNTDISAASWDTSGHPIAIWRINSTNDFKPEIEYHAP